MVRYSMIGINLVLSYDIDITPEKKSAQDQWGKLLNYILMKFTTTDFYWLLRYY